MQNITTILIEDYKLTKLLIKSNFYNLFRNYISFEALKNEIGEVVKENRNIPIKQARSMRTFRYIEVYTFIINNDLQHLFLD